MFNNKNISLDDILIEMDKNILKNAAKNKSIIDQKKLEALAILDAVADVFEKLGMYGEAEALTKIAEIDDDGSFNIEFEEESPHSWKPEKEEDIENKEDELYDELTKDDDVASKIEININEEEPENIFDFDSDLNKMWD